MDKILDFCTAALAEDGRHLVILDQTLLPNKRKYLALRTAGELREAIRSLRVRGAPALGIAGACGYCLLAEQLGTADMDAFVAACARRRRPSGRRIRRAGAGGGRGHAQVRAVPGERLRQPRLRHGLPQRRHRI